MKNKIHYRSKRYENNSNLNSIWYKFNKTKNSSRIYKWYAKKALSTAEYLSDRFGIKLGDFNKLFNYLTIIIKFLKAR